MDPLRSGMRLNHQLGLVSVLLSLSACTMGSFNSPTSGSSGTNRSKAGEISGGASSDSGSGSGSGSSTGASASDRSIFDEIVDLFTPSTPRLSVSLVRQPNSGLCTRVVVSAQDGESNSPTVTLGRTASESLSWSAFYSSPNCDEGSLLSDDPQVTLTGGVDRSLYVLTGGTGTLILSASAEGYPHASSDEYSVIAASWHEPLDVADAPGGVSLPLNAPRPTLPQIVSVGDRALTVWVQGHNLFASVIDPSGPSQSTQELELLGGAVRSFHVSVDADEGENALVAWVQDIPSEGRAAVFARLWVDGSWGAVQRLGRPTEEGYDSLSVQGAISNSLGAWVVYAARQGTGAASVVLGSRLSLDDEGTVVEDGVFLTSTSDGSAAKPHLLMGSGSSQRPVLVVLLSNEGSTEVRSRTATEALTLLSLASETLQKVYDFSSINGSSSTFRCVSNGARLEREAAGTLVSACAWLNDSAGLVAGVYQSGSWSALPASALVSNCFEMMPFELIASGNGTAVVSVISGSAVKAVAYASGVWGTVESLVSSMFSLVHGLAVDSSGGLSAVWADSSNQWIQLKHFVSGSGEWVTPSNATAYVQGASAAMVRAARLESGEIATVSSIALNERLRELRVHIYSPTESSFAEMSDFSERPFALGALSSVLRLGSGFPLMTVFEGSGGTASILPRLQLREMKTSEAVGDSNWKDGVLSLGVEGQGGHEPQVLTDESGKMYRVSVARIRFPNLGFSPVLLYNFYQIRFSTREAGSSEWSAEQVLSSEALGMSSRLPYVRMVRNARGDILVAWQDTHQQGSVFYDATASTPGWKSAVFTSGLGEAGSSDYAPEVSLSESGVGTMLVRTLAQGVSTLIYHKESNAWTAGQTWATSGHVSASDYRSFGLTGNDSVHLACFKAGVLKCGMGGASSTTTQDFSEQDGFSVAGAGGNFFLISRVSRADSRVKAQLVPGSVSGSTWSSADSELGGLGLSPGGDAAGIEVFSDMNARGQAVVAWGAKDSRVQNGSSSDAYAIYVNTFNGSAWSGRVQVTTSASPAVLRGVQISPTGEAMVSFVQNGDSGGRKLRVSVFY